MTRQLVTVAELTERFEELLAFVAEPGQDNDVVVVVDGRETVIIVPAGRWAALNTALHTYRDQA